MLPTVTSHYPPYDNAGYPQDTSLKIYFNKPIKLSDFAEEDGTLKNVIIKCDEKNLLSQDLSDSILANAPYYINPYLEDDGKTLVIPANKGHYFLAQNDTPKDITLNLSLENLTDNVEGEYALFSEKKYDFTYRVNGTRDSTDPVFSKLYIAKNQEDALNGENLITFEEFKDYALKANYNDDSDVVYENIKNHHAKKVWIYFEADDIQSGIDSLEIQEQLIRSVNGQDFTDKAIYGKQTNETTNYKVNNTLNNGFSGLLEYDFVGMDDGVVKLSFIIKDRAGNTTTKVVDLIKDTRIVVIIPETQLANNDRYIYVDKENDIDLSICVPASYTSSAVFITDMDGKEYLEGFMGTNVYDVSYKCFPVSLEWWYKGEEEKHCIDLQSLPSSEKAIKSFAYQSYTGYAEKIKCTISANPYKNIEYCYTYSDPVGNTGKSRTYSISILGDIIAASVNTDGWKFTFDHYLETNHAIIFIYENTNGIKTNFIDIFPSYTGIASNDITWAKITDGDDPRKATNIRGNKAALNTIENGTFYVYLCRKIDDVYLIGQSFTIYKTDSGFSTNLNTPDLTYADVPAFEIEVTGAGLNSGKLNCHVTWDESFIFNNDYYYFIKYENGDQYYSEPDFTIPCNYSSVKFSPVVYNKNGASKTKAAYQKTIVITQENDTASPIGRFSSIDILQGYIKIKSGISDKISGLNETDGKTKIKVLTSDTPGLADSIDWENNPDVQEFELVTEVTKNSSGNDVSNDYLYLPVYDLIPKYMYYYIEDKAGNALIDYRDFPRYVNSNTAVDVNYVGYKKINPDDSQEPEHHVFSTGYTAEKFGDFNTIYIYSSYINGKKWEDLPKIVTDRKNSASQVDDVEFALTDEQSLSFIKLYPSIYYSDAGRGNYEYGLVKYRYVPYLISPDSYICDLKDYYEGHVGLNIMIDKPCFVHTLYSPRNFGDNVEKWLNYGMETGLEMKQNSFTYKYTNYDSVPDGYYYTTVIHFADGETLMTDVKHK